MANGTPRAPPYSLLAIRYSRFVVSHRIGYDSMKITRRGLLALTGAAGLLVFTRVGRAQAYPTRSVRIVAGFLAGSTTDIVARLLAHWLQDRLGQPFIVENRPGAGGTL